MHFILLRMLIKKTHLKNKKFSLKKPPFKNFFFKQKKPTLFKKARYLKLYRPIRYRLKQQFMYSFLPSFNTKVKKKKTSRKNLNQYLFLKAFTFNLPYFSTRAILATNKFILNSRLSSSANKSTKYNTIKIKKINNIFTSNFIKNYSYFQKFNKNTSQQYQTKISLKKSWRPYNAIKPFFKLHDFIIKNFYKKVLHKQLKKNIRINSTYLLKNKNKNFIKTKVLKKLKLKVKKQIKKKLQLTQKQNYKKKLKKKNKKLYIKKFCRKSKLRSNTLIKKRVNLVNLFFKRISLNSLLKKSVSKKEFRQALLHILLTKSLFMKKNSKLYLKKHPRWLFRKNKYKFRTNLLKVKNSKHFLLKNRLTNPLYKIGYKKNILVMLKYYKKKYYQAKKKKMALVKKKKYKYVSRREKKKLKLKLYTNLLKMLLSSKKANILLSNLVKWLKLGLVRSKKLNKSNFNYAQKYLVKKTSIKKFKSNKKTKFIKKQTNTFNRFTPNNFSYKRFFSKKANKKLSTRKRKHFKKQAMLYRKLNKVLKKRAFSKKKIYPQNVKYKTKHVASLLKYFRYNRHNSYKKNFYKQVSVKSSILPFWKLLTNNIVYFSDFNRLTKAAAVKLAKLDLTKGNFNKLKYIKSKWYKNFNVRKYNGILIQLHGLKKTKSLKTTAYIKLPLNGLVSQKAFLPSISYVTSNSYKNKNDLVVLSNPINNTFYYLNTKYIDRLFISTVDINYTSCVKKKFKGRNKSFVLLYQKLSKKGSTFFSFKNLTGEKKRNKSFFNSFKNSTSASLYKQKKLSLAQRLLKKLNFYRSKIAQKRLNSKAFYFRNLSKKQKKQLKKKELLSLNFQNKNLYQKLILQSLKKNNEKIKLFKKVSALNLFSSSNLKKIDRHNEFALARLKKSYLQQSKLIQFFNKSEKKEFKWKFFNRKWHFAYSRWKQSIMFKRILKKAWSKYRKLQYNFIFLKLYRMHLYLIYGINELQLWEIWSKIRKGNNKESSNLIQLQQAFSLKLDSLCLLLGLAPNRLIANELVKLGGFRVNGLVTTNSNFILSLNDVLQLDLDLNNHVKSLHNKTYWNKIKSRINFIPYFQVMWSLMLITLVRWPYKHELIEESILTERWLRFYLRYLPAKKSQYKKSTVKWLKY